MTDVESTAAAKPGMTALDMLREPFPDHQISKLPKPTKRQTEEVKTDYKKGIRCTICGTWHHPDVVHLDYVGHAALTDRLLNVDDTWSWEPVAFNQQGLPALDGNGGLWIRLTVAGVSRLGYGDADGKSGGNAVKEAIGDALRNAAMRFGAALDLWHKGDLHLDHEEEKITDSMVSTHQKVEDKIQKGGQSGDDEMTAWADKQIARFAAFKAPSDFTALSEIAGHANYKAAKDKIAKADKKLWDRLHTAEGAAFQRTDDVPF